MYICIYIYICICILELSDDVIHGGIFFAQLYNIYYFLEMLYGQ